MWNDGADLALVEPLPASVQPMARLYYRVDVNERMYMRSRWLHVISTMFPVKNAGTVLFLKEKAESTYNEARRETGEMDGANYQSNSHVACFWFCLVNSV